MAVIEYIIPQQLSSIEDESLRANVNELVEHFKIKYNKSPEKIVRVPGRVNLIGEHIDYCGFPVCPMAFDNKQILLAISEGDVNQDSFIKFSNVDSRKYEDGVVSEYKPKLDICYKKQGWISYILCGIQGVLDKNAELKKFIKPKNSLIAVNGTIPPNAGLSSSSALVCAGFIGFAAINDMLGSMSKIDVASLCAEAEHYIGTIGGGMDQAIAVNAKRGTAKLVKFNPLRIQDIELPHGAVFMIANSLTEKSKVTSNDFNVRVVECRLAGQVLAKCGGIECWKELLKLANVKKALDFSFPEMFSFVDKVLHNEPYTKEEICEGLEISPEELNELSLTPNTSNVTTFKLKERANHVYGEADRVYMWRNWCAVGKKMEDLGILMQRSHSSLQQLYECSHPELDKLVSIFTLAGAYGARLTGAGWGGCVVALVARKNVDNIKKTLDEMFYRNLKVNIDSAVFVVEPGEGAEVFDV